MMPRYDIGRKVFDEMPDRAMVRCWTSLIAGSAQSGQTEEVLRLFFMMVKENLRPENDTIVSVLSACSKLEAVEIEKWVMILSEFINDDDTGSFGRDSVNTVLAYLYGKWGKRICPKWLFLEALSLFRVMIEDLNLRPNHVTMVSVLSACAQVGDLDLGKWIHGYVKSEGCKAILESNTFLATALIDMRGGIEAFLQNARARLRPNSGTFLGVLCACSHSGLLDTGRQMFLDMIPHFSVPPELEHYACYVDLLARVGLLEEAFEVVASMPFVPNNFVWGALLQGCRLHSRLELAQDVSQKLVKVDPENSAGYVMFSNALASDQQWGKSQA
ncbi:Pentatricopeptide repeat-containing protein, chloroplastic [Vitis vinifera]|uniref:Pentatricopeptide repeat-containing protein, chloroplastic n=1 Tax=Vitis vinifera TaxID=29760 RepID=A0A438FN33_VITVI|nr:Pentatricopeptide repeat-containing protein, chloroplastic [Vitis vinifera]